MLTASTLMKRELVKISGWGSVQDAARLMKDHRIGSVFVHHQNDIIGIVTETDIIRRVVGAGLLPEYIRVTEIMSSPVVGIELGRPLTEAADAMNRYGTRHLAVFERGSIVGVLSVRDLLHPVSIDEF
jgi:CBS domain-containing protein